MATSWELDISKQALAALPALDNHIVAAATQDYLLDAVHPGAPLLITFAYIDWANEPDFYFFGRSKKLERLTQTVLNRVLLRDRSNRWYLHGVPGLGEHVDETVAALRRIIDAIQPNQVWCVGESMGGYAAIMYGMLLHADRILSFGPLSSFDPAFARRYHDRRWLSVMESVAAAPPLSGYYDLPALARQLPYRGELHLVVGTSAGEAAPQAVNLDVLHAQRFGDLPHVHYHYFPDAQHTVTPWLLEHRQLDRVLLAALYGQTTAPAPGGAMLAEMVLPLDAARIQAAEQSGVAALLAATVPHAPLLICFGDAVSGQPVAFDFGEISAQLAALLGTPLNRVLLRDPQRAWYRRGVVGVSHCAAETEAWLQTLVDHLKPTQLWCIGNGQGGYAAIACAARMHADRVIAFNPLSTLDAHFARHCHDLRNLPLLLDVADQAVGDKSADLLQVVRQTAYGGRIDVVFGTLPAGDTADAGSQHGVHAERLALLPNVRLHAWTDVGDELFGWLSARGELLPLLRHMALV